MADKTNSTDVLTDRARQALAKSLDSHSGDQRAQWLGEACTFLMLAAEQEGMAEEAARDMARIHARSMARELGYRGGRLFQR